MNQVHLSDSELTKASLSEFKSWWFRFTGYRNYQDLKLLNFAFENHKVNKPAANESANFDFGKDNY